MRMLLILSCSLLLGLPATAQTSPRWGLAAFYTYEALNEQRPAWHVGYLGLQRRFAHQTIIADVTTHRRFNQSDVALGFESWSDLWTGAYGNLRLQYTPEARFLPNIEAYLEIYQSVEAWELALSVRPRFFPDDTVPTFGLALARYEGNWYLRTRTLLTVLVGHVNWMQTFRVRRYQQPPLDFLDLQAGFGRGVEIIDVGPVLQAVRTYFVAAHMQRFITRMLGLSISLSYSNDNLFTRQGLSLGLLYRW